MRVPIHAMFFHHLRAKDIMSVVSIGMDGENSIFFQCLSTSMIEHLYLIACFDRTCSQ